MKTTEFLKTAELISKHGEILAELTKAKAIYEGEMKASISRAATGVIGKIAANPAVQLFAKLVDNVPGLYPEIEKLVKESIEEAKAEFLAEAKAHEKALDEHLKAVEEAFDESNISEALLNIFAPKKSLKEKIPDAVQMSPEEQEVCMAVEWLNIVSRKPGVEVIAFRSTEPGGVVAMDVVEEMARRGYALMFNVGDWSGVREVILPLAGNKNVIVAKPVRAGSRMILKYAL